MPRTSKIKWRKKDNQKITSIVRRFNAKLTRTLKKNPELAPYLPERLTTAGLREKIKTRQDFNRETKSAERFLKKGSEEPITTNKGIKSTKWEIQEIRYKVQQINRQRKTKRKKADVSTEKGTMGTIQANSLQPKKFNINTISPANWEAFKKSVEKQVGSNYYQNKDEQYKENYLKALYNVFGSQSDFQQLQWYIKQIPASALTEMYYNEPILQIDFIYDPIELEARFDAILETLASYVDEEYSSF